MTTAPVTIPKPTKKPALANPRPIQQLAIEWTVLTNGTVPEGDDWVFFGLTTKGYENLALNQAELLRYITEAMYRLNYYRGEDVVEPVASDTEEN